jgi:uncharacterized protein (TIGR02118 family)
MIRVSVFYPAGEGKRFDHDYYLATHGPLMCRAWGLDNVQIDKGLNGPHVAAVHFFFESMEQMGEALSSPSTADVIADVANFTDIDSFMQISESF